MGPDEWLLIAEDDEAGLGAKLEAALAGVPHSLVDVSHRRCAIELAGAGAARLLNAGVPLDLDLAAFPVGMVGADAAAQGGDRAVAARGGAFSRRNRALVRALRRRRSRRLGARSGAVLRTIRARERRLIGVFELFKVGIGPSSSHTVGPMKAAAAFAEGLALSGAIERVEAVVVTLYGSLAFTGKGHATDKAVILGLSGERPDTIDPDRAEALVADVAARKSIVLCGRRAVRFDPQIDIRFDYVTAPKRHPNTLALLRARRGRRRS